MKIYDFLKVFAAAACLLALEARAEITATVYPGYQFNSTERPTTSTLNLLGRPTISITGTLGGTNVSLGAGTVSGTMLMDSVAGSNLTYNGATPRGLVIQDSGVSINQINVAIAGDGLGGGGGFPLSNKVDNVRIKIISDVVSFSVTTNTLVGGGANNLLALGAGLAISGGTIFVTNLPAASLSAFSSIEYSLSSGQIADTNHSLGSTPRFLNWVMICKTSDNGYAVGDEVPVSAVQNSTGDPSFVGGANATNVFIVFASSGASIRNKSTGNLGTITTARWNTKCYAAP